VPGLTVPLEVFEWYLDQALDQLLAAAGALGDERVNRRPDLPGANSAFAIVTHCLGVIEYWGGAVIAGRTIRRDRAAEFVAAGTLAELADRVAASRRRLAEDLATLQPGAAPRQPPPASETDPWVATQDGVALHLYEELSQHLGQLELTRDLLLAQGP
jgi:hypothetical protein